MSAERINQITHELTETMIAFKETCAKVLPLIRELEDLGVPLPPETRKMFLNLIECAVRDGNAGSSRQKERSN